MERSLALGSGRGESVMQAFAQPLRIGERSALQPGSELGGATNSLKFGCVEQVGL